METFGESTVSPARAGVALGVDLGSRRIGIARSDSSRVLAHPYSVILRSGNPGKDHDAIAAVVEETGATVVVVGLPLSLSGRDGPAAKLARSEIAVLSERLEVAVIAVDERLSTVEATRRLAEGRGVSSRRSRSRTAVPARRVVDDAAAAVILQSWLDSTTSK